MTHEFDKRSIPDFGEKLDHLEGVLGAYLPRHIFDSDFQQKNIECKKHSFSRLRSGQRRAANWELARFVELFELGRYGFDYRLFFEPVDAFHSKLETAGVGSYGTTAAHRLREALRDAAAPDAHIKVHRDTRLNVGGIGSDDVQPGFLCLTQRDRVTLTVPLKPSSNAPSYLLLLHDFPGKRAMSCLMPSVYAPVPQVSGKTVRLPQHECGELSFPVNGITGYRCLYGIQCSTDLASYIGLSDADSTVPDIQNHQIATLVDFLQNTDASAADAPYVSYGEYLLQ